MDCENVYAWINARLDGELAQDEQQSLAVHLDACPACQSEVDEFERVDRELARLFETRRRSAAELADRVLEQWAEELPQATVVRKPWSWPLALAAGLALAFTFIGIRSWLDDTGESKARVYALVDKWTGGDASPDTELSLRAQGPVCVTPLLEFVTQWRGDENAPRRVDAARLASDLADTTHIPDLIALLGDSSPEIRTLAEGSLTRLTGWHRLQPVPDHSVPPTPMMLSQASSCSNPQAEWQEWWEANKHRFQGP